MNEIKKNIIDVDGTELVTFSQEVMTGYGSITVEAGTDAYKRGTGTKYVTNFFRILMESSYEPDIRIYDDNQKGFSFSVAGAYELWSLIEAFQFIIKVLEDMQHSEEAFC